MADQNLTEVTAIIAAGFLLIQVVIFMICLSTCFRSEAGRR